MDSCPIWWTCMKAICCEGLLEQWVPLPGPALLHSPGVLKIFDNWIHNQYSWYLKYLKYLALIFGFTINSNDVSGLGLWRWPRLSRWHRWGWVKVLFVVKIFGRVVNLFGRFWHIVSFLLSTYLFKCLAEMWKYLEKKINKMPDYHCHSCHIY